MFEIDPALTESAMLLDNAHYKLNALSVSKKRLFAWNHLAEQSVLSEDVESRLRSWIGGLG